MAPGHPQGDVPTLHARMEGRDIPLRVSWLCRFSLAFCANFCYAYVMLRTISQCGNRLYFPEEASFT